MWESTKKYLPLIASIVALVLLTMVVTLVIADKFNKATNPVTATKIDAIKPPTSLEIEYLVNVERAKVGKPQLIHSNTLEKSACLRADDMIKQNYFGHNAPDGKYVDAFFDDAGYKYRTKGSENLTYSHINNASSSISVNSLMNSKAHREAILDDYTESGVCVKKGFFQGEESYVVVQHFGIPG